MSEFNFWNNGIPFSAVVFDTLIFLISLAVTISILRKYFERKKKAVFYLSVNFTFISLALFVSTLFRYIAYFSPDGTYEIVSYSDFGNIAGLILVGVANIFIMLFSYEVFSEKKLDLLVPFGSALNAIAVGLLIPYLSFVPETYRDAFYAIIVLMISTMLSYGILSYFAFKESKLGVAQLSKTGFRLIGWYGNFIMLVFFFLALDSATFAIFPELPGYTPFYYIAWTCSAFGLTSGFLGLIMPNWFRTVMTKRSIKKEKKKLEKENKENKVNDLRKKN